MANSHPLPSAERLNELLRYDTGRCALVWRKSSGRARAEAIAGYQNTNGWRRIVIDKKPYSAYRILNYMLNGEDSGTTVFRPIDGNWKNLTLTNGKARVPRLTDTPTGVGQTSEEAAELIPDPQAPEATPEDSSAVEPPSGIQPY